MVGVPRSTGCGTCIARRVKCDQDRPECRRCRDRKLQCPGYQRRLKFYHQTPGPDKGRRRKEPSLHQNHNAGVPSAVRPSMDAILAPSLATTATDTQMKEVFHYFVMASFPGLFSAWRDRVQLNWLDYVRHHLDTSSQALMWSIRSLSTWHLGQSRQDQEIILNSRRLYGRGLRHLIESLRDPRSATSNWTLMAAIHLGIYEMLDGLGERSWLIHSRGIRKLFCLRGPEAHRDGFGRTLLVAYRAFLVADAFASQEPCILAEREWRSMNHETVTTERKHGKSSQLGEIVEFAFDEIVLCPGLFVQTRDLIAEREASEIRRESLVAQITRSRDRLRDLVNQMGPLPKNGKATKKEENVTGLIPIEFAGKVAHFTHQGMRSGIAILSQLLIVLEADKLRPASMPWDPWRPAEVYSTSKPQNEQLFAYEKNKNDSQDRLDQLALSMGMLALRA